jgi:hypothetical protein
MATQVLKNYNLFIDSSQRDEGNTPSYFSIVLTKPITKVSKSSYFRVRIPSLVIPFSFSQINSTNQMLTYTCNGIVYILVIPTGNYSITDLLQQLQSSMEFQTSAKLLFTYDVSTSKSTLGFDIANLQPFTITMNYTTTNIILMKIMGFTSNVTFSFTPPSAYTKATSNQGVNVSPSKTLFIRSETLLQSSNYESLVDKNSTSDILLQIPINTSFNTYINYNDQTSELWSEVNNTIIDKINLYISDSTSYNELPADSGLLNWFCQINIQEVYRADDFSVDHITNPNIIMAANTPPPAKESESIISDLMDEKEALLNEIKKYQEKKKSSIM